MKTKHVYIAILFLLLAQISSAQSQKTAAVRTSSKEIENSCRIKAKDVAAETYRGCVSEQKNAQMEQIKHEYQVKLQALKAYYDAQLKKMSGKAPEATKNSEMKLQLKAAETAPTVKAEVDESTMDIPEPVPVESSGI
jgi:hypothetical protein